MDQASLHTCKEFTAKIPEWQAQNIEIFYLPAYTPELNMIEILWRFMKYAWIELWAYTSWTHMVEYVENILKKFGTELSIRPIRSQLPEFQAADRESPPSPAVVGSLPVTLIRV